MKFQATYRVTVYTHENTIIVGAHEEKDEQGNTKLVQNETQLTCKFSVTRGLLSGANKCTITLYNLAPKTRESIFQDMFQLDEASWKYVKLEAGYDGNLSEVFSGRILQAYSYRSGGQTDMLTEIQAQAFDIFGCQSSHTFEAGTTKKEAVQTIVNEDMPNVSIGNVGELDGAFLTNTTVDGTAMENLSQITGGNAFVDNGQLNVLMSNEVIDVPVPIIKDETGLLDTPNRRDASLEVKMLFEPSLIVGQLLEIQSETAPIFNGQYKVMGFTHDCTISGAESGTRTTTVTLYYGTKLLGADVVLTGNTVRSNGFNKVSGFEVIPVNSTMKEYALGAYKYIQVNKGKIPPWYITNNISWKDMIGHSNNNNDRYTALSYETVTNIVATANKFQEYITKYFPSGVTITSGWRSPRVNANCGGVKNSQHLYGKAIDFNRGVGSLRSDYALIQRVWNVGYTYLNTSQKIIHIDTRGFKGYANDK